MGERGNSPKALTTSTGTMKLKSQKPGCRQQEKAAEHRGNLIQRCIQSQLSTTVKGWCELNQPLCLKKTSILIHIHSDHIVRHSILFIFWKTYFLYSHWICQHLQIALFNRVFSANCNFWLLKFFHFGEIRKPPLDRNNNVTLSDVAPITRQYHFQFSKMWGTGKGGEDGRMRKS